MRCKSASRQPPNTHLENDTEKTPKKTVEMDPLPSAPVESGAPPHPDLIPFQQTTTSYYNVHRKERFPSSAGPLLATRLFSICF